MVEPALKDALDQIIDEIPNVGAGGVAYDPQPEFEENIARIVVVRSYVGTDRPIGFSADEDGVVRNTYHFYLSTSALTLVDLARRLDPVKEGLDGIVYLEVNQGDTLTGAFRHSETASGTIDLEMAWDLSYLWSVLRSIQGDNLVTLASIAGGASRPQTDDFDIVQEIVEMLDTLSNAIGKGTETTGKALKIGPKLWDPKERSDSTQKVIDDAAAALKTVATALKSGLSGMVTDAFKAMDKLLGYLQALFESPSAAVVDFLSEKLGSVSAPVIAAKELAKTVLTVLTLVRRKVHELLKVTQNMADWFSDTFGSLAESVDVMVGYFAGIWNGLVDTVLGVFDTVNLVVSIILGLFRVGRVTQEAFDLSLEIIDEII